MGDGSDSTQQTDDGTSLSDMINGGAFSAGQNIAAGLGAPSGLSNIDLSGAGASFASGALGTLSPYLPYLVIGGAVLVLVMVVK